MTEIYSKSIPSSCSKDGPELHDSSSFSIVEIGADNYLSSSKEQLSNAISSKKSVIIFKDMELGKKTLLWMALGGGVHNTALAMATGSIMCSTVMNEGFLRFAKPLALGSFAMDVGYHFFWDRKPLMHYRIAPHCSVIQALKNDMKFPTIIVERKFKKQASISTCISAAALTLSLWGDKILLNCKEMFSKTFKIMYPSSNGV